MSTLNSVRPAPAGTGTSAAAESPRGRGRQPMNALELEYKPDAEQALQRMEAWWVGELIDRPAYQIVAPREKPLVPVPKSKHPDQRSKWMDVEYQVARAAAQIANTLWLGDRLPAWHPNLGPDYLAATMGSALEFAETTSWSEPALKDWADLSKLRVQPNNLYLQTMLEMTRQGCAAGKGKFLVGITDLHPGGDLAAALRGPQQFCLDVIESPRESLALMNHLKPTFYEAYEAQHQILREHGQTVTTTWLPVATRGKYYVPSNDFSCMVSPKMFEKYFVEEIEEEVQWLDRTIYHLDGPQAIPHLDRLLAIKKLDAIQYVYGDGARPASKWLHIYRKIQAAGKSTHVHVDPEDVETFIAGIGPKGVMVSTWAESEEQARALQKILEGWKKP